MTQKLDLLPDFTEGLAPDLVGRLSLLDDYQLPSINKKVIENSRGLITHKNIDLALRELKRYLALAAIFPDQNLVPSRRVDVMWHELILVTPAYRQLCNFVFGRYLNHNPQLSPTATLDTEGFSRTLAHYREAFGEPPAEIWGAAARPDHTTAWALAAMAAAALAIIINWRRR
jgi:hypothetical protein